MKSKVLGLILIINAICFILYTANLFYRLPKFGELVQIVVSILCIISVVCVRMNEHLKVSYYFLSLIYFLQSFSFLFMSFAWKLIIGPDLSIYVIKEMDLTSKLDFKVFNLEFLFNTFGNTGNWVLGLNFFHLIIFFYLIKELRVIKQNK